MITTDNIIAAISNTDLKTWFTNAVTTTALPSSEGAVFLEEIISAYRDAQTTYNEGVATGDPIVNTVAAPNIQTAAVTEDDGSLSKTEAWTITLKKIYSPDSYLNITGIQP
ncbi:MAG: hypothetical protein QNJ68_10375 [Microcoleaceae cyanobacterium MO_207.B10]|nr:hypothetical protein [Microcoleaceae cyanobacterium MO_207.B10]